MNKTAIKNYAVDARKKWIAAIAQQAAFYGCTENGTLSEDEIAKQLADRRIFLTQSEKNARSSLVNDIKNKGYQNTIEEVAYTWFNRLIAIRFMEVNGYLPSSIRVLSSADSGRIEPDCVREYARLDFIKQDTAQTLAAESDDKLYRYILVEQCRALGTIMPKMFTHIADYAALLLPERLYIKDGLVHDLIHAISEEDFGEQVEIIGWLYQYYISEKKDEVFAALKKNVKITRENIPAATQLFTPDWIVKYMVENSLGRLWLERDRKESGLSDEYMNASYYGWKYYIEEAEQTPEVRAQLDKLVAQNPINKPEDIRFIDPCMGSGHILVYAFDVLFQIYQSIGYADRDIPDLILQNNIYGLDIDERACQLAYFALMMKARSYNRRFFRREEVPQPQVYSIQDSERLGGAYQYEMGNFLLEKKHQETLNYLLEAFRDAREYGSILKLEDRDYQGLAEVWRYTASQTAENVTISLWYAAVEKEVPLLIEQAILLTQKYDVVVTNPPYMGASGMGGKLAEYVKKNYPDSKSDLFAVFIEKCGEMLNANGYQAMITQHAWMFLSSYEKLRAKLMRRSIINMAHLGPRAFEEISGEVVQSTTFVMAKAHIAEYEATFVRLVDFNSQRAKEDAFLAGENRHTTRQENFQKIPSNPVAYWVSSQIFNIFDKEKPISKFFSAKQGFKTGNNDFFLKFWFEVSAIRTSFNTPSLSVASESKTKWFPCTKGGEYRKWYGNFEYVVNWENDGFQLKNYFDENGKLRSRPQNIQYNFRDGLTWSSISSAKLSMRFVSRKMFESKGPMLFADDDSIKYLLGCTNAKPTEKLIGILAPTLDFSEGSIGKIPFIHAEQYTISVNDLVEKCINTSRADWDSFETSWDFQTHPLIAARGNYEVAEPLLYADDIVEGPIVTEWSKTSAPIAQAFDAWERETDRRFDNLKSNEEELNRIFIDIYGLQEELTPEVEDKDVTVRRADLGRDIRSFVSYAVGCMFGRYSLDTPGLAYAGGEWDDSKYSSFFPDAQNILPITDADYFGDDIVMRFVDFVRVVYGEETLAENLEFIAKALYPNGNGTAREMIRRYFQNDFFKDHCKIYQKRPIYWLFDSGKQNGFKALIYLHRYDKYTVARVRTEYLHPLQRKYEAEIVRMEGLAALPETSARDKAEYKKQTEKISKQIAECRAYDQIISHMAGQQIELDLDDGVKVNYAKFQGVEVPRGDSNGTVKMDLLGKI